MFMSPVSQAFLQISAGNLPVLVAAAPATGTISLRANSRAVSIELLLLVGELEVGHATL